MLERYVLLFIKEQYPNQTHCFMQDNDPKHMSHLARNFFEANSINRWKTPPESPDLKICCMS